MMPVTAAALLLVLMTPAHAQSIAKKPVTIDGIKVGRMADTEEIALWRVLASSGITSPEALRTKARTNLADRRELPFDFQRLEVTGVASVDDTEKLRPGMVDKQIKTSNLNEVLPSGNRAWDHVKDAWNYFSAAAGKDIRESLSDTRGIPTERSANIIAQLKDVRVNELYAHSWGTEVVYLGILNGDIIPPKKLVIMGVPEDNQEKWLMLAKYTGIEIHVVAFEWDKLKMAGDLGTKIKSGLPPDTAGLNQLWTEKCAKRRGSPACADPDKFIRTKFEYNVHVRPPDIPKGDLINGHLLLLDHEREHYYTYLANRNLFNTTVAELDAPQLELVKDEENRILAKALIEARAMTAAAKAAAKAVAEVEAMGRRKGLWDNADSAELRRKFADLKSIDPGIAPAAPASPAQPAPVRGVSVTTFMRMLPAVKIFAAASCRSPGQIRIPETITQPSENIHFAQTADDQEVDRLSAGLGTCEGQLFRRLVDVIRKGNGPYISDQWMEEAVRSYSPPPADSNTQTPVNVTPDRPSKPGCSVENGVMGCPK